VNTLSLAWLCESIVVYWPEMTASAERERAAVMAVVWRLPLSRVAFSYPEGKSFAMRESIALFSGNCLDIGFMICLA